MSEPAEPSLLEPRPGHHAAVTSLLAFLADELKVHTCADEAALLAPAGASAQPLRCLADARLRVQHHFDLTADVLIVDAGLGSLGLVHLLTTTAANDVHGQVSRFVDQAAYLLHLLAAAWQEGGSAHDQRFVPAVELVLLVPAGDALAAVSAALRETLAETDLLDGLGVNVLPFADGGSGCGFDAMAQWRAFAWLLGRTRLWFDGRHLPASADGMPSRRLQALTTRHFRLGGERTLRLAEGARVHVVHGQNGSGKTSIAEALELVATGCLRRLGATTRTYREVLRNRAAGAEEASIHLGFADPEPAFATAVVDTGIAVTLAESLNGMAVVLDQATMDGLTRADAGQRAASFIAAFFPEEFRVLEGYRLAEAAAAASLAALPAALRAPFAEPAYGADSEELRAGRERTIAERFGWVEGETVPAAGFVDCLPLPPATLAALRPVWGEQWAELAAWLTSPPPRAELGAALGRVDEVLASLRAGAPARLKSLAKAVAALAAVQSWRTSSENGSDEAFGDQLNRWLELTALTDLAEKKVLAAEAIARAEQAGWSAASKAEEILAGQWPAAARLAELRQTLEEWREERDRRFAQLKGREATAAPGRSGERPQLHYGQVAALNEAGAWAFTDADRQRGLGDAIAQALAGNRAVTWGSVVIGQDDLAVELLEPVRRLHDAYGELVATGRAGAEDDGAGAGHGLATRRLAMIEAVVDSHAQLRQAGVTVQASLLARLESGDDASLRQALTELTYLFTPARWAYQDLSLKLNTAAGESAGQASLALQGPDRVDLDLRLNAAELYSIALALFLLCARRTDNPLRLLVLDDPFQNMDEMTVGAVCRGIRRLLRLWPADDWQLLVLLHREADARRFQQEVPCAEYRLPWLSPGECDGEAKTIEALRRWQGSLMLDLGSLMRPIAR